jgi:hypothetical protein
VQGVQWCIVAVADYNHRRNCLNKAIQPELWSGYGPGRSKSGSVRGNLFGCLIGPKGTGKTRTIERCFTNWSVNSRGRSSGVIPGSEHGLMLTLEGKAKRFDRARQYLQTLPAGSGRDAATFGKSTTGRCASPSTICSISTSTAPRTKGSRISSLS